MNGDSRTTAIITIARVENSSAGYQRLAASRKSSPFKIVSLSLCFLHLLEETDCDALRKLLTSTRPRARTHGCGCADARCIIYDYRIIARVIPNDEASGRIFILTDKARRRARDFYFPSSARVIIVDDPSTRESRELTRSMTELCRVFISDDVSSAECIIDNDIEERTCQRWMTRRI